MIQMPLGPKGSIRVTQSMDDTMVIHKNAPHPEVAAEFLSEVVFKRENIRDFCLTVPVHLNPPIKGVDDDPPTRRTRSSRSGAAGSICRTRTWPTSSRGHSSCSRSRTRRSRGRRTSRTRIMGEMVTAVVSKGMSPADAMKAGEKATSIVQNAKNSIKKA